MATIEFAETVHQFPPFKRFKYEKPLPPGRGNGTLFPVKNHVENVKRRSWQGVKEEP